jgi:hypothetical protein
MPATPGMQATAVTQASAVTPAKSNSRNESSNRSANTVWMPAKAGMLANSVADPDPGSGAFVTPGSGIRDLE